MSTFPSKREKSHSLNNLVLVLAALVVIGLLVVFGSNTRELGSLISRSLESQSSAHVNSFVNDSPSFASDEKYWEASCAHGWTGDSTCDLIVARVQSCDINTGSTSAYCSEYKSYLRQFQGPQ